MDFSVDHVTVAGCDLNALTAAFTDAGFPTAYGGSHSNGITHMAVVGFRDGSYIELISTLESNVVSPWWNDPIHGNGGPCAWAVHVDDIAATSATLRKRSVAVEGPAEYDRERPDGTPVEWELAFLGEGDPGSTLPFLISDRTPREHRVESADELTESPIVGVDTVVLAVHDLESAFDLFETAFGFESSEHSRLSSFDADLTTVPDTPVALAEPTSDGWLANRLNQFGPRPIAYVLETDGDSLSRFDATSRERVAGREVKWLSLTEPVGRPYLGVVDADR